jgi:hypothetical protein
MNITFPKVAVAKRRFESSNQLNQRFFKRASYNTRLYLFEIIAQIKYKDCYDIASNHVDLLCKGFYVYKQFDKGKYFGLIDSYFPDQDWFRVRATKIVYVRFTC